MGPVDEKVILEVRALISRNPFMIGELLIIIGEKWADYIESVKTYTESKHLRAVDDLIWVVATSAKYLSPAQKVAVRDAAAMLPKVRLEPFKNDIESLCSEGPIKKRNYKK